MQRQWFVLVFMLLTILLGCDRKAQEQKIDNTKLAIMTMERVEGRSESTDLHKTEYLPNDYGFLINWPDNAKPEFYLYNKPLKSITCTSDFNEFLAGLKRFPGGAKVDCIEKCQSPFAYKMPDTAEERLWEVIKTKRYKITEQEDGNFIICTCEFSEPKLLKTAERGK